MHTSSLETVPESESADIATIKSLAEAQVRKEYSAQASDPRTAHRDAHAKHHGCVRAQVDVKSDLPEALQSSVFTPGASYSAWVRFSNGSGRSQNDQDGDGRGMAIKLIGVSGEKVDGHTADTQDFNLINHPVFFVRNTADYVEFQQAIATTASPIRYFFPTIGDSSIPNPFAVRLHEMRIAKAIQRKKISSPLTSTYFSMAPILFRDKAAKISTEPCAGPAPEPSRLPESPNYLREAMEASLSSAKACFRLKVQLQTDREAMPVEDPTIEWDERESPYVEVATLTIDKQAFTSDAQMKYCENLSFNPWHAAADHRPLGGINRTRKVVYEAISRLRHELNSVTYEEPTDLSVPNE